jgi:hypothetical protein
MKKIIIFKFILQTRIENEKILFKYIKEFLHRKKIRKLIERNKDYYFIVPGEKLQNISNLKIKFFFDSKKSEIYPLKFCPYRKFYYFEFKRIIIRKLLYKFYFIFNGNKMIDIKYKIMNTKKDGFINVINLKEVQEKEFKLESEYDKEIKLFYSMIMTSFDTASTLKSGEFYNNKRKFKNSLELCKVLKNKPSVLIYENIKPILKKNNLRKNKDKNSIVNNKKKITFSKV